jgi:hypothetical protein
MMAGDKAVIDTLINIDLAIARRNFTIEDAGTELDKALDNSDHFKIMADLQ